MKDHEIAALVGQLTNVGRVYGQTQQLRERIAQLVVPAVRGIVDDMCARIKAADDAAAMNDYMLDSDDCISVLLGTWRAPSAADHPKPPTT
ncbi:hypothetical protein H4CHR_02880 [Variovorax sp. PBS-H4]|uniref:hypothetical protein n=1 Tax=Variovorax sp. PBS-H4 TaxID=434008 RepID=UPI001318ED2A|nr:hypothetical protein [Variovorax sp. PBS-H4]VTU31794.1 hypothetical protein H4CHR_02880 [Variovorax sp. PBS-H4]